MLKLWVFNRWVMVVGLLLLLLRISRCWLLWICVCSVVSGCVISDR